MNWRFWTWFQRGPDLRFVPLETRPDICFPIQLAKAVKPEWLAPQYAAKQIKLARCPGMWDYLQAGYIIPAPFDIHIKANSMGAEIRIDGANVRSIQAALMDHDIVAGMTTVKGTKPKVFKIPLPWAVHTKPGISCQVLPALMHSPFLDKVFVYPGMVDYEKFSTINCIVTVREECEFTIWAGTPLAHVIPFKRQDFHAEVGVPTQREQACQLFGFGSRKPGFYRKWFHFPKKYTLTVKDDA